LKRRAEEEATRILDDEFSYSQLSIVIATKIHNVIKEVTHNPDPYRAMKEKEMTIARELYLELSLRAEAASQRRGRKRNNLYRDDFKHCLKLAAAANAIDFFREHDLIKEDIRKPVSFAIDDSQLFELRLKSASKVLYLADNAGEMYLDLPLVKWIGRFADVTYVVKPSPAQDDTTVEDIRKAGLEGDFGRVMTTGIASPGIVFSLASLSELPSQGRFFYCLMAKCKPVANSLGVPLNSYVAMLW
jgi:uncharacterized protein with ATP-grasp and redox domains